MLTFNTILKESQIDPRTVLLVRHQDNKSRAKRTPYTLWLVERNEFELYQSLQSKDKFHIGKSIASFVVSPKGETLFAGLYHILGKGTAPLGMTCPVSGIDCQGHYLYELKQEDKLSEYTGLLSINWGKSERSWVQHAFKNEKPVRELRIKHNEEDFPGFTSFCLPLNQLKLVPDKWRAILEHNQGVYLLTCRNTGKQYVGSAKGSEGFWQRFCNYERTKHGGNVELKGFDMSNMWITVLQVVHTGTEQIEKIEQAWKEKLQSKKFGLNSN